MIRIGPVPVACLLVIAALVATGEARADEAFWRNLAAKYGDGRPAIGLLNECLDYVTYAGEIEFTDVTQQSGLEATKTASGFKGSQFAVESRVHWTCAVIDASRVPELATFRIPFHSARPISGLDARIIARDGVASDVPDSRIHDEPMAPGFPAYADLRWRVVDFGTLPDSCVIDVKFSQAGREAFATNSIPFDHPIAFDRQRYTITAPNSVVNGFAWWTDSFRADEELGKPKIEAVSGSVGELQRYEWVFEEAPEVPVEELAVPLTVRARRIDLAVAFERDWEKMLAWYRGEVERVASRDARGAEMAAEIVRGVADDSLRARALYEHVKQRVRWVQIPVHRTKLVPDAPSEVLERGYGDAKDIASCLTFLMRSVGLEAHMALVATTGASRFDLRFPTFQSFDHAVVHLLLPLREVWLDATDPHLGFGGMSESVRGGRWDALTTPFLVWEGSPNFWDPTVRSIAIEAYGPGDCGYSVTDPQVVWDASGTVTFRATLEMRGAHALALRRGLRGQSPDEQARVFGEWLARSSGAERVVEMSAANIDSLEADLRIRYAVARQWTPGADEVRIPSRFFGLPYPQVTLEPGRRFGSVAFPFPEEIASEVPLTAPDGYSVATLPADLEISSGFLRFERSYVAAFGSSQITSSLRIEEPSVDAAQFGRLVRALEMIRSAGDEEIVFVKTPLLGKVEE
jgi:transglutaminase-like putative cysteine protease